MNKIRIFKDKHYWCVYFPALFDSNSGWETVFHSYEMARAYAIRGLKERQLYYARKADGKATL